MLGRMVAALLAAAAATPAVAGWKSATSTHFVVYTQGSEASARETAERLEKFNYVLRAVSGTLKRPDSPIKIKVFMVPDTDAVQALMPFSGSQVAGFYTADIRGPLAVMPRGSTGGEYGLKAQQILFHELTHHFQAQYFPAAYPTWYREGLADYYGSIQIGANNVVSIGSPVENRFLTFQGNAWEPIAKVLNAHRYGDVADISLLYAEGWALVHYLSTTKARPGQLSAYLKAINAGQTFEQAAASAFGDLGKLDAELQAYTHRQRLQELVLPFKQLAPGPVEVRTLSPGEDAMVPIDVALTAGVPASAVQAFADRAKQIATHYPDDVHALALLAEAERLAGHTADETAAIDRWVELAPKDGLAMTARAVATMDALSAAKTTDPAAWSAVRKALVQANTLSPDQPRTLRAYYDSYAKARILPTNAAQNALFHALEILPQDGELRMRVAADFEARGMIDEAIVVVRPLAYSLGEPPAPMSDKARRDAQKAKYRMAGEIEGETAREMLARLEKKKAKPA